MQSFFPTRPLVIALAVATTFVSYTAPASAQTGATTVLQSYDIPAGDLGDTLRQIARQSNKTIAADPGIISGKRAAALKGQFTAEQAAQKVLGENGLELVVTESGTLTVRKAPTIGADTMLPVVKVTHTAAEEHAPGPVPGYVVKRSAIGTKTDASLLEIPQSISVVGREEMDDRGVTNLAEAARYVPGLHAEQYGSDPTGFGWFGLRGFNDTTSYLYIDGLRSPNIGYTARINDPYGIERIDVLRGPASVLFGQGDAGGLVNVTSKRPSAETTREITLQYGTFQHGQIGLDLGGPLTDGKNLNGRLIVSHQEAADQERYPGAGYLMTRHTYVAPSLAWHPSDDTSLLLLGMFLDQDSPGSPYEYIGADLKRTRLLMGQPGFGDQHQRQHEIGYQFEHHLNSTWTFRQNLRSSKSDVDMDALYGPAYDSADPETGEVRQRAVTNDQEMRYTAVDTQLVGALRTGAIEHTAVIGLDFMDSQFDNKRWRDWGPSLNIYLPPSEQYNQAVTPPTTAWQSSDTQQEQLGVYVQDQIRFEQWVVTLGGRFDHAKDDTDDRLDEVRTVSKDDVFSGRAGVSRVFSNGLAPYASYTESFLPQTGIDADGNPFEPTRGKQYELGVKYAPPGHAMLLTAALFDLKKNNVPTTDSADPDYQRLAGEIRSRGLELEGKAELSERLKLIAQYTYNDVEVTRSNDANLHKHPINVPDQMASMWADYSFTGAVEGLSAGLGVRYVGKRYGDDVNTIETPDYTLLDAAIRYETGPLRLALNIGNLLDKDYVASYAFGYYRGVERTAVLAARYRF